ncbi:Protein canopy-like protein 2 [Larimichthys crocea]|uniref:Protein canopy-like protein 2 n=1 Tax=Larimichthys crocea TaxID=215358 RepID=A0A6G0J4N3_LARCR|nr:Protein canopy-like protein 2 [Larimichthys crocea]
MATGRVHLPAHAAALSRARVHPAAYVTTFHRMRWHSVEAREVLLWFACCTGGHRTDLSSQAARPGQDMRCGACRALVDEMEWAISQIDPKKMIQTGSFRINPDGSQSIREVPLARSEGNLLELMESVCERMEDYGEHTDPSTNRKSYIRVKSRSGEAMDLSEATLDSRVTASLKFACETIVEHNEDEVIEFFAHETDNVKDKLCSKRTDLCDHALKMPHDEL